MLERYMTTYGIGTLAPADSQNADPFWVAAANGSTDALRFLLEQYVSDPVHQQKWPLEDRRFSLLSVACSHPHVETVKLLLDSQMPVWKVNERDFHGRTALLDAAESLCHDIPCKTRCKSGV